MSRSHGNFAAVTLAVAMMVAGCTPDGTSGSDGVRTPDPRTTAQTPADSSTPSASQQSTAATSTVTARPAVIPRTPVAVTRSSLPTGLPVTGSSTIADGLDVPWGIAFLPGGDAIVSARDDGQLLRIDAATRRVSVVATVRGVVAGLESGLLGVAVAPTYATDKLVYAYLSTATDNRVVRGTLVQYRSGTEQVIVSGIPHGLHHNGGRLAFGPDEKLYVTTGESGVASLAPSLTSLGGKILRINPDGSAPRSNPFGGSRIWSYGHRNVQGIAWDSQGRLWASEFGDHAWDEVNLILPGRDYGWPQAEGTSSIGGLRNPSAVFGTEIASPSGLAYAGGHLWLGALEGQTMWRLKVRPDGQLGSATPVRVAVARTRTIAVAPDGRLWVTSSNTDGRVTPGVDDDRIRSLQP